MQDITLVFGSDKSRFYEYSKRAVFDRDCGPLIKMLMTRCIHRTRCVRFLNEISGTNDFGMLGRGENSEIGTYVKQSLVDELSGNIVDLCPVGALTSKPYSFKARPWELISLESIDVLDSMASNIRIDFLNNRVYRVLPIYDKNVNEDWITNKARYSYDSNIYQRIDYPMLKVYDNKLISITWRRLLYLYFFNINKYLLNGIVSLYGSFNDLNFIDEMSRFFNLLGTEVYLINNNNLNCDFRKNYFFDQIINVFDNVNNFLFVGTNIRLELPLLNSKLRKYMNNYNKRIKIFFIGLSNSYHNIPIISCGNSIIDFIDVLKGKNNLNKSILFKSTFCSLFLINKEFYIKLKIFVKNSVCSFNAFKNFIEETLSKHILANINFIIDNISLLNVYEKNNYRYDNLYNNLKKKFIFLSNIDENFISNVYLKSADFLVYHGQFVGLDYINIDLLIPSSSIYEYNGVFLNLEGRIRKLTKVISQNFISSYDFFVILKLCYSNYIKTNLSFIKKFNIIIKFFEFMIIDWSVDLNYYSKGILSKLHKSNVIICYKILYDKRLILNSNIINYYKSDIYSLNSKNMHLASLDYLVRLKTFI